MPPKAPRVFVSAGEPSGDLHAARVAEGLRRRWPEAVLTAFGGPALRAAGARVVYPMERYTVIGFLEAVAKIPAHLRLLRRVRQDLRAGAYDLVILVDYPGFNLRLAGAARQAGVPTLYYIAPQLWAWRPGRASRMRAAVDRLAVILPFEPAFFASLGLRAEFVGHPLAERQWPTRSAARAALGLPADGRVLALFPGSRRQEIRRLWPAFAGAARRLLAEGVCSHVVVAGTRDGDYPQGDAMAIHRDGSDRILAAADAALVKSGTTTLEAAMTDTPMVVAYRVHPLTATIARRVMTVSRISLVNLVAGRDVVPELVQQDCTPGALAAALRPLLGPGSVAAEAQRRELAEVRERLGGGGAADRVVAMAGDLLA